MSVKIIQNISRKVSTNGKDYHSVVFGDGSSANCWDGIMSQTLLANMNKAVDVEAEQNGKYWNIVGVKPATPEAKFEQSMETQVDREKIKSDSIAKAVALKASIEYHGATQLATIDAILETANKFTEWLTK